MLASLRQGARGGADSPIVQIYTLGTFRVLVNGRAIQEGDWRRRSARQLLKLLITRPGRRMTRDEIVDLLWPESENSAAASSNLRSAIHALRRALVSPDGFAAVSPVCGDHDSVWLAPAPELWVDADDFERTVAEARRSPAPLPLLDEARRLYGGDYLPDDLYDDWATDRRRSLKSIWVMVESSVAEAAEARADLPAAVDALERLVAADGCDERAAQQLMRLLARQGRRPDAVRVYQRLAQSLREELDVEPSPDTVRLHRQIAAPDAQSTPAPPGSSLFRCAYPFPLPTALVGREAELELLRRLLDRGTRGGAMALIAAPAGAGKSALVGRLVGEAQDRGVLCLAGGCYEERGEVPLGPFQDALVDFLLVQPADRLRGMLGGLTDDLAQVVPELRYHLADGPATAASRADRARAFAAIHAWLRALADQRPVVVCLEDLHAADEATLRLVHYLARHMRNVPLTLIGTYRDDEVAPDQPLAQTVAAMRREQLVQMIRLASLSRSDTDRLVGYLLDGSASEALGDSVYVATAGNPLFVEQLLFALREAGQLRREAGAWHAGAQLHGSPQIVREVIAQRLHRLAPSCRGVLSMASVLGQSFEHRVLLAAMYPVDEQSLLKDMDRAIAAQVLQEKLGGYAFRHALVRDAVYSELGGPRRMLLHARAAELLERLHGERADEFAPELAYHFLRAGESSRVQAKALHYSRLAGKRSAEMSSYPESLSHYGRAYDLIEANAALADRDVRLDTLNGRGWAEANIAHYGDSIATYREVLQLTADPIQRGRARKVIAFSLDHTSGAREAIHECQAGLDEIKDARGPEATEIRATLQQLLGLAWYLQGRFEQVLHLGRQMEADTVVAAAGPRMLAHKVIGWGYMGLGQLSPAIEQFELAVAEAMQWGDKPSIATSHGLLGQLHYLCGRFPTAREHLAKSLALYRESANELRAAMPLNILCRVWLAEGDYSRARAQVLEALNLEMRGHERFAADAYYLLGMIHVRDAEWNAASAAFEQALTLFKACQDVANTVEAHVALGFVDECAGRWSSAASRYLEAVALAESMDPAPQLVLARRSVGRLRLVAGDLDAAEAEIESASALAESMVETPEYAPTLLASAELNAARRRTGDGLELARHALQQTHTVEGQVEAHAAIAGMYLDVGDFDLATQHGAEAVSFAAKLGSPRLLSLAHLASAKALAAQSDGAAVATFEAALRHAGDARTPFERLRVLTAFATHLRATGSRPDAAMSMETDAATIARELSVARDSTNHSLEPSAARV